MLIRNAEIGGEGADIRLADGRIAAIGALPRQPGEDVCELDGGAVIPGLADHHIHLRATAAAAESVDVSAGLGPLLADSTATRAIGWPGDPLTAADLDRLVGDRAVRVQHRSGALWMLSSAALRLLPAADHPGIERDEHGNSTGLLWRADDLVRGMRGPQPDLEALAARLRAYGITRVTDATPRLEAAEVQNLQALPLKVSCLGDPGAHTPWKVMVADHCLDYDTVRDDVEWARTHDRAIALHCVSAAALALALAVLSDVGGHAGDRIEHAAVVPRGALIPGGPVVVTQPAMPAYRSELHSDRPGEPVFPHASLLAAGIRVALSSDAPYGPPDPWEILRVARDRSDGEAVPVEIALRTLVTPLEDPAGLPRRVVVGAAADLCLLRVPLAEQLRNPSADNVLTSVVDPDIDVRDCDGAA